jgi:hypothetical protein
MGRGGFWLLGQLGQKGTGQAHEEHDLFYLFELFPKGLDLNQLKGKLPVLQIF